MAKQGHPPKHTTKGQFKLEGNEDLPATYADIFVVASETESNMATIFFFQSHVQMPEYQVGELRTTQLGARQKAQCVSRILLTPQGVDVLLRALADNRGLALVPKVEESK